MRGLFFVLSIPFSGFNLSAMPLDDWLKEEVGMCQQIIDYNLDESFAECLATIIHSAEEVLSCKTSQVRYEEAIAYDSFLIERRFLSKYLSVEPVPQIQDEFNNLVDVLDQNFPSELFPSKNWELVGFESASIHASAAAGGKIVISSALWEKESPLTNDETLAVLSHEMAHVVLEHSLALGCLALEWERGKGTIAEASENFQEDFTPGFPRRDTWSAMSQRFELEADALGVEILRKSGNKPEAMFTLLSKLGEMQKAGFSRGSHPEFDERLAQISDLLQP